VTISSGIATLRESIAVFGERKGVFVVKSGGFCCAKVVERSILDG